MWVQVKIWDFRVCSRRVVGMRESVARIEEMGKSHSLLQNVAQGWT